MTRTPAPTSAGASSAAAASGSARNTTSASRASVWGASGTIVPFHSRASPGKGRDDPAACPDDIAEVSATAGCRESSRSSSWPEKPVAPRSYEHTSELQSHHDLVCRLLLEKKKQKK